jgi:hypothetical protein
LNSVPDRVPALVLGLIRTAAMRQLMSEVLVAQFSPLAYWPPSPSSQVMKMTVERR